MFRGLAARALLAALSPIVWLAPEISRAAQSVPDAKGVTRALATTYADGRTAYHVLRPSGGWYWTPAFPRVPNVETSRKGLPLGALDVAYAVKGSDVTVTVSLRYGSPFQEQVTVATVRVVSETPVRVDQLRIYGVEPISLSIVSVPPMLIEPSPVVSASAQLDAVADVVSLGVPAYRIVMVNRSTQALMGFQWQAHRGGRVALSGRRKGDRHVPLIQPGGQYVFEFAVSAGTRMNDTPVWQPYDRVVITSVMWGDGTVEGDAAPAARERAAAAGSALQIGRVLALLREANQPTRSAPPARLRSSIASLSIGVSQAEAAVVVANTRALTADLVRFSMELGMRQVKEAAMADLDAFTRAAPSGDAKAYGTWLAKGVGDYEGWLARIKSAVR